jgi:tellurite resistance protein TehA-like permease
METIKNFTIGVLVIFMGLILSGLVLLTWPVLIGITSFLLSVVAIFLFIVLVFYVIVLIGHIARMIISRK